MLQWPYQWWLGSLALARAWRWRGFFLASIAAAWWLARQEGFPTGSLAWFPLGSTGVLWLTCFLAMGALVLGVDCLGQWDRHRARALLETRLIHPTTFLTSQWAAVLFLGFLPAAVVTFWAPIGAWRAGLSVAWEPSFLYFLVVALPAISMGAAAGLLARALVPSDSAALVVGLLLVLPFLYFRLIASPAEEIFLLTSESLGVLLPASVLWREALLSYAFPLPFLGLATFLLPRPRGAGILRPKGWKRMFHPGWLLTMIRTATLRLRQHTMMGVVMIVVLILPGIPSLNATWDHFRERPRSMDWLAAVEPEGVPDGRIDTPRLIHRSINLPKDPLGEMEVELTFLPRQDQTHLALTFGNHLGWISGVMEGEELVVEARALSPNFPGVVLRLPREVPGGEEFGITGRLRPHASSGRLWERAWHPRFHRFSFLGPWYGETLEVNYPFQEIRRVAQKSPFRIEANDPSPLVWSVGSAKIISKGSNRVELVADIPERVDRLVAGNLEDILIGDRQGFPLVARVLPNHTDLVRQFDVIFSEQFLRLGELFPQLHPPIVLQEVPELDAGDPLAVASSTLDRLRVLLPRFDHFESPTRGDFFQFFEGVHHGLVEEAFERIFSGYEEPSFTRDALIEYIHSIGLRSGQTAGMRRAIRREIILIPWPFVRGRIPPIDVAPGETDQWMGPLFPANRAPTMPPPHPRRALAFHHMLRGLMGDDPYTEFLQELFSLEDQPVLTLALFRELSEKHHGENLGWFFDQWLNEGVLPSLHIVEGRGFLLEEPATRALVYRVQVTIENRGTGRVHAPWMLATEGDPIEGNTWLEAGERADIELTSHSRPLAFELDPQGWIVQPRPERQEGRRSPRTPQLFFRTITEI